MTREEAFSWAVIAARSGAPMHPKTYRAIRDALGILSPEEESILRSHRLAREADESRAEADRRALETVGRVLRETNRRWLDALARLAEHEDPTRRKSA